MEGAGVDGPTTETVQPATQQDKQSLQPMTQKDAVDTALNTSQGTVSAADSESSIPPGKIQQEKCVDELKKNLVQMGYNLASEMGFSIFIKLVDIDGNGQYYGTKDLIRQYYCGGLKVNVKDVPLNGKTGLPVGVSKKAKVQKEDDVSDDNDDGFDPPSLPEFPGDSDSQESEDQISAEKRIRGISNALSGGFKKSIDQQSERKSDEDNNSKMMEMDKSEEVDKTTDKPETPVSLPSSIQQEKEGLLETDAFNSTTAAQSPADVTRRRKRKAEHPQKIKLKLTPRMKLPPKKRKIQVTIPVARKPTTRGRKPGVKNKPKKPEEKPPRKPRVKKVQKVTEKNADGTVVSKPKEKRPHTRTKNMQCKHCEKQFRDKWHLDRHERSHTGEKPFVCNTCGKAFSSSTHFKEHQMRHAGKRDWVCELCSRDFYFKADLAEHVKKVHASGKGHTCKYCKKAFSQDSQLKMHEEDHISDEEKPLVCMQCSKKFAYPVSYARHHRSAHGATTYLCPFCDRGHPTYGNLKNHLTTHSGQRPFQCDQCGKTYASEGGLKWHLVIHGEGKSFACEHCGMKFFRKIDLSKHLTVHTDEKRYVCEMCGSQFKRIHSLNKHQQRHMGVVLRPYKCGDCGKAFDTAAHLKRHVSIHTGDKPHECQECKKRFNRKDNLRTHMKVHGYGSPVKADARPKIPRQKVKISRPTSESESGDESYSESDSESLAIATPPVAQQREFHSYAAPNEAQMYIPQPPQAQPVASTLPADNNVIAEAVQSLRTIQWSHIS
ncbi:uncharacterized protein LOC144444189 [Glandiceps talaboti]